MPLASMSRHQQWWGAFLSFCTIIVNIHTGKRQMMPWNYHELLWLVDPVRIPLGLLGPRDHTWRSRSLVQGIPCNLVIKGKNAEHFLKHQWSENLPSQLNQNLWVWPRPQYVPPKSFRGFSKVDLHWSGLCGIWICF